jgi:hypothetical protein
MSTPIIELKDGIFVVNEDGLNILRSIEGPLGVITVAGKYRTGKSFMLNYGILESDCFRVGNNINACTRGLHIANKTIRIKNEEGVEFDSIVLDCEGFDSIEADDVHDSKIFIMAVLLSSMFIYNTQGTIDEHSMQTLSTTLNISNVLLSSCIKQNIDFPSFLWVIRDFALDLNGCTENEYLENSLLHTSVKYENSNALRKSIRRSFSERSCITIARPCTDEKKLQNVSQHLNEIRPEFKRDIKRFRELFFKKTKPKKICNMYVNGAIFIKMIREIVDLINNDDVLTIPSTTKLINNVISESIVSKCIKEFEFDLNKYLNNSSVTTLSGFRALSDKLLSVSIEKIKSVLNVTDIERNILDKFKLVVKQSKEQLICEYKHKIMTQLGSILSNGNVNMQLIREYHTQLVDDDNEVSTLFTDLFMDAIEELIENKCGQDDDELNNYKVQLDETKKQNKDISDRYLEEIGKIKLTHQYNLDTLSKVSKKEVCRLKNDISQIENSHKVICEKLESDLQLTRDELVSCDDDKNRFQSELFNLHKTHNSQIQTFENAVKENKHIKLNVDLIEKELKGNLIKIDTIERAYKKSEKAWNIKLHEIDRCNENLKNRNAKEKKQLDITIRDMKESIINKDIIYENSVSKHNTELLKTRSEYENIISKIQESHIIEIEEFTEKLNLDKNIQRDNINELTSKYRDQNELCMRLRMDINRLKRKHGDITDCSSIETR